MKLKTGSLLIIVALLGTLAVSIHAAEVEGPLLEGAPVEKSPDIERQWGIRVIGVRLSASDYMLDFRYRVIDPENAWHFVQKRIKPFLINQTTGKRLPVQQTRLGPMRQTAVKPAKDRDYIIIFANTGKMIKRGDKVTVVIGDFKAEDLIVE